MSYYNDLVDDLLEIEGLNPFSMSILVQSKKFHKIDVLDKGFVQYVDHMGSDKRIVEAARVSYGSPSKGDNKDKELLNYLYRNRHTSPFEMCKITFHIKLPIFVMRQFVRHRMQNLNEFSIRYAKLPEDFYIPQEWRSQAAKNKQSSDVDQNLKLKELFIVQDVDGSRFNSNDPSAVLNHFCKEAYALYEHMLESGISREMARLILPLNTYTVIYSTFDLHNLMHFIRLREDKHAQWEMQEYARAMKLIAATLFPWTFEAYERYKVAVVDTHEFND